MAKGKSIKVCLTNRGEDTETPWATDLGPAPGPTGSRKVRLDNIPFLHARPTYGDTIVVSPDRDGGFLTWDRKGVAFSKVETQILEDGGRWAMIVDYDPHPDRTAVAAFKAIVAACEEHDIVCEGAWAPRGDTPGRIYLAVPERLPDTGVMGLLRLAELPCELIQIHPTPPKKKPAAPPTRKPARRAATRPTATPKRSSAARSTARRR